ncbi:penicillin-binding protein 2 [Patescibacteria group bacterium]|nr:penicillin-binding protein 2 [Patescibacteria group bacterium]
MTWRYKLVLFAVTFAFILVILRLFYWQVVRASDLSAMGQAQYGSTVKIMPERGNIETSDGFPIAASKISYLVFADPKQIPDKNLAVNSLTGLLNVDPSTLSAELSLDRYWVPLKDNVDIPTKQKIEGLNLPGIGFSQQYQRYYPEASMAAQLLGFVGKDAQGNDKGYFGLEGYYDRLLQGKEGVATQILDAFGRPILTRVNGTSGATDGDNLILNINRSIQFLVEKKLKEGIKKYGAVSGMVGIMDPKTGNILAMASYPNFDPRDYQNYSEDLYKNPFISDLYEPGSTFKPIVMSAALNENLITPQTTCPICSGPVPVGGYLIHTWDDKYFPNTTMIQVIQHSDNTGMVFVAQKLGVDRMISALNSFGIGSNTGIDLQGEVSSPLKPNDQWYPVDLATTGFGQGISVTPIELLDAIGAIANGGKRMEPHVVAAVQSPDGSVIKIAPKVVDQPISPQTAKVMTEIMVNAVNNGEAAWTRLKGYRIAGKTGTASIPIAGHYDPTQTIASFIGFAPADNPKFVMLVILNKPSAAIYGSETAAPIFFDIAKDLLAYYGIPPSQ